MDQYNFSVGVESSIQNLRPGSKFILNGTTFQNWEHELPPPTWEEVMEQLDKDIKEYESQPIRVVDNFLYEEEFKELKNFILFSGNLPWYTRNNVGNLGSNDGYFLMHMFYYDYRPSSEYFKLLNPILSKISPLSLIRIKANFYPTTPTIINHDFHVDFSDSDNNPISCKACLFYLNTNNGKTVFKTGEQIQSIENRALFFNPSMEHCSTTCTDDAMGRFNINFNYF